VGCAFAIPFVFTRAEICEVNGCRLHTTQDETIEPALSPKTFDSNRLSDGVDDMHGEGVLSHGWHEVRQWMVEKYYDKNFKFMLILLILVIAFGTVNRVIYRIQLYALLSVGGHSMLCVCVCARARVRCDG
jgi:hypothetical protein